MSPKRRVSALIAALVVLFGIARGGALYFHCAPMNAVLTEACCAEAHAADGDDDGAPAFDAPECCRSHRLGTLPIAAARASFEIAPPAPSAVLPPVTHVAVALERTVDLRRSHPARAGPPPLSASARRAELMIWNS